MKEESGEDQALHNEEIEKRVDRMLDPRLPDEPVEPPITPNKPEKVQSVSVPVNETETDDLSAPSAPELPDGGAVSAKNDKKIAIPITQHDERAQEPAVEEKPVEVKQITIADHSGTPAELAKELDESIADLEPEKEESAEPDAEPETKPEPTIGELMDEIDANEGLPEESEPEADIPLDEPAVIADPETDKAVAEIVAAESDELLEVEDAVRDTTEPVEKPKKAKDKTRTTLGKRFKNLWAKPAFRWALILLFLASILAAGFMPQSRYYALNTAGVRARSSLTILDQSTGQPLKNVHVRIGGATGTTDAEGKTTMPKIKLGATELLIEKAAFAPVNKKVVIGWGSNPLGEFKLTPVGAQYTFAVKDFLSGKPISKIEATSGESSAVSDDKGVIKLTIDKPDEKKITVSIAGQNYRTEKLEIDPNDKTSRPLKLVSARKHIFVTKRSGKYDIYSIYIDGKDEKLVLAGSGHERDDMVIVPHPTAEVAAYVSTRADQHNSDGFLVSNLILLNTADNTTINIGASERVQIVDWEGDHLVYVQIAAGASANSPKRYRLMSYNYKDATNKEIASSNYFNDVIAAGGAIYYAPSSAYQSGPAGFYKVNADGSNLQTVFNKEVWNVFRTSYDRFSLSVQQEWYDYRLGDKAPTKQPSAPTSQISRIYIDSPDGKHSTWIENRDGKGTLLSYDPVTKNDTSLLAQSGLTYPLRWLDDNTLVYRVKSPTETADYVLSTNGGTPVKIHDVTNSGGISSHNY